MIKRLTEMKEVSQEKKYKHVRHKSNEGATSRLEAHIPNPLILFENEDD